MAMAAPVCRPPGRDGCGGRASAVSADGCGSGGTEAEHAEQVLGPQPPSSTWTRVELLGEAVDGQRGQLPGVVVDEREVVAGVLTLGLTREHEPAADGCTRRQRGGEVLARQGEPRRCRSPGPVPPTARRRRRRRWHRRAPRPCRARPPCGPPPRDPGVPAQPATSARARSRMAMPRSSSSSVIVRGGAMRNTPPMPRSAVMFIDSPSSKQRRVIAAPSSGAGFFESLSATISIPTSRPRPRTSPTQS